MNDKYTIVENLFKTKYFLFLSCALRITEDYELARDAIQEAMISVLKWGEPRKGDELGYMVKAVINKSITAAKKNRKRKMKDRVYSFEVNMDYDEIDLDSKEGQIILKEALTRMVSSQAIALEMRLGGADHSMIADKLGITKMAVSLTIRRAVKAAKMFIACGNVRERMGAEMKPETLKIIEMRKQGYSVAEISAAVNIPTKNVHGRLQEHKDKVFPR